MTVFSREWAMPSGDTFSIKPIASFIDRWLSDDMVSIDPFARNSKLATYTNDLSPDTAAQTHMDAEEFCRLGIQHGVTVDLAFFDPPYSPRQMSEIYQSVGLKLGAKGTQNGALYKRVRDVLSELVNPGGVVLSFGWNSGGMGLARGFDIEEIMLVAHGGAHNDTICLAERKRGT